MKYTNKTGKDQHGDDKNKIKYVGTLLAIKSITDWWPH